MNEKDREFFTNAYLMITSVIQAAALGALVFAIKDTKTLYENWPYLALSFLTTVVLSYGYVDGARRLLWPLDGLDILIPFMLGLFQSLCPISLSWDRYYYFVFYLLFAVTGVMALANAWIKTAKWAANIHQERRVTRVSALIALLAMGVLCSIPLLTNKTVYFTWCAYCLMVIYSLLFAGWCYRDWRLSAESADGRGARPVAG